MSSSSPTGAELEGGALWSRNRLTLRAVGFWSRVDDAIVNVTLGSAGGVIVRAAAERRQDPCRWD